ncbi:hypothetical protein M0638_23175 [Roseomonas sp. NAR14]|uniref:Serine/threonine protein kinase n=1 Tax=Roseomonas acroporae TaxID=2937791 RepID=A0A9X1YAQ2_9PROT|nr:hypothetical protein [Roseomonas acroporae]MCK8787279.1 hypothetical protein [Roseomonas acroporae]
MRVYLKFLPPLALLGAVALVPPAIAQTTVPSVPQPQSSTPMPAPTSPEDLARRAARVRQTPQGPDSGPSSTDNAAERMNQRYGGGRTGMPVHRRHPTVPDHERRAARVRQTPNGPDSGPSSGDNIADRLNAESLARAQANQPALTPGPDTTSNLNRMSGQDAARGVNPPQPMMPFR